jgi:hypothetical protein
MIFKERNVPFTNDLNGERCTVNVYHFVTGDYQLVRSYLVSKQISASEAAYLNFVGSDGKPKRKIQGIRGISRREVAKRLQTERKSFHTFKEMEDAATKRK